MARIGTWRKIEQNRTDMYIYTNNVAGRVIMGLIRKNQAVERPYWFVEVVDIIGTPIKYLAGGSSGVFDATKGKAFELARDYMRHHPGTIAKPSNTTTRKHYGRGRHACTKTPSNPTYSKEWSGVSYAPHAKGKYCPTCGENLHDEDGNFYCPKCDDYKTPVKR